MQRKKPGKYRLLVTISVLFTVLITFYGLFFRQFIFWQTSNLLLDGSDRYFSQVSRELILEYQKVHQTVSQALHILAKTDIVTALSSQERMSSLQLFQAAIQSEPKLSALQVGYPNGDYFIVRPLLSEYMRRQFSAPEGAILVVDTITADAGHNRLLVRSWYDTNLLLLAKALPVTTSYDPRTRPWYRDAQKKVGPTTTAPYLFHFIGRMGLTIALASPENGAVVAGDVTLYHLSETMAAHHISPRSELVLLEQRQDSFLVTAYKDPNRLVAQKDSRSVRAGTSELGSEVLAYASGREFFLESFYSFEYQKEKWLGAARKLNLSGLENIHLVMLSPEQELLSEARAMQNQTMQYTLVMIVLAIPFTWLLAQKISKPLQLLAGNTKRISLFEFGSRSFDRSIIKEVDELGQAMNMMESTISRFILLINSLAGEQNFDTLIERITQETMNISGADAAFTYIVRENTGKLQPGALQTRAAILKDALPVYDLQDDAELVALLHKGRRVVAPLDVVMPDLGDSFGGDPATAMVIALPLCNRRQEGVGILCLLYDSKDMVEADDQSGHLAFIEALSGFAAVTLEGRKMLRMQKDLLASFVTLLAGAIDSKSPYTGGHCQRVPVLAKLLARKACEADDGPFADFHLSEEEWEALHIASWLHDCGKVTTPEFVVDKATKLETISDRIHEIRTRFEVLKRDVHIIYWQRVAAGEERTRLDDWLSQEWQRLDEEFAIVAECNLGAEVMQPDRCERLKAIAAQTFMRTLDDRIGISWEELQRKERTPAAPLPAQEFLLADREDHLVFREAGLKTKTDSNYGFSMEIPQYLYNRGEIYNLTVVRGTLTAEERFMIKDHIVQTIIMLQSLPYPGHLQSVPDIAGSHHEKMDGSGYPRGLHGAEMSIPARIIAIADIFEALTAEDRPYKKSKKLSEVISIMKKMAEENHIDRELFQLFLQSGAYLEYGRSYLQPEQIDEVKIQ